jgi:hypothetical protein
MSRLLDPRMPAPALGARWGQISLDPVLLTLQPNPFVHATQNARSGARSREFRSSPLPFAPFGSRSTDCGCGSYFLIRRDWGLSRPVGSTTRCYSRAGPHALPDY